MFDFGSILGSSPRRWSGVEYMYEGKPTLTGLYTLGFWRQPWLSIKYPGDLPVSVSRIEGFAFDPEAWKPEYPNVAFGNMRPDDAFWGARIVAAFSDEAIAAIVKGGVQRSAGGRLHHGGVDQTTRQDRSGLAEWRQSGRGFRAVGRRRADVPERRGPRRGRHSRDKLHPAVGEL